MPEPTIDPERVTRPRYAGTIPEMVVRALLRNPAKPVNGPPWSVK